jgi:hypothetical protein
VQLNYCLRNWLKAESIHFLKIIFIFTYISVTFLVFRYHVYEQQRNYKINWSVNDELPVLHEQCMRKELSVSYFSPPLALQPNSGLGHLHETFRFTSVTRSRIVGRTPWTDDQLVARPLYLYTNTEKRTQNTNTKHP